MMAEAKDDDVKQTLQIFDEDEVRREFIEQCENDPAFRGKLVRKLDFKILPLLCLTYFLAFLDRGNIGNAKLGGLQTDLHMTDSQYQWSLSIFFFGYVIFELPSNLVLRRWKPSKWIAIIMFAWGAMSAIMAGVSDFGGLATMRLLLGVWEAGLFPGVVYYLSLFYPRKEFARRIGYFWSFSSLAGAFGGMVAAAITQIKSPLIREWQTLFLIEGLPNVIIAAFIWVYLPDSPETARFLDETERKYTIYRLAVDNGAADDHSFSWAQVRSVFYDWKTYPYMLIYITGTSALQGVTLFLPSIIAGLSSGFSTWVSQLLTTPAYILALLATILATWSSDKYLERSYHLIVINLFGMAGFLMLMYVDSSNVGVNYVGAMIVTASVYANVPVKVAWFNNNFGGLTRRAVASAAIVSVGTIGGAIGGQIYYDKPKYFNGNRIALICLGAQSVLVLIVRFILVRENKRRDALTIEQAELEVEKLGGRELAGDRVPAFRYIL
ncbi:major facilitator superfamily domain-containing protein [Cladochytrium replicatum]|nr:major facilitator superfamily domain-containing protein [Cladochytrium replicatum]